MRSFNVPVRQVHQIELTSRCSLACRYCPSPMLGRVEGYRDALHMPEDVFAATLSWLAFFCKKGTQGEVNLAGIGESTMRGDFLELAQRVRAVVGGRKMILATNGLHMTEELAAGMAAIDLKVYVSLHRPEKAGPAIELCKQHGILDGISVDPSVNANDWAGQVKWHNSGVRMRCPWLYGGWVFVRADGKVSSCCLDAKDVMTLGDVRTADPARLQSQPGPLCRGCYQIVDWVPGFEQAQAEREPVLGS